MFYSQLTSLGSSATLTEEIQQDGKALNCTTSNWRQGLTQNIFCTTLLNRIDYMFPIHHVQCPETSPPSPTVIALGDEPFEMRNHSEPVLTILLRLLIVFTYPLDR